jgi:hypothetical protein
MSLKKQEKTGKLFSWLFMMSAIGQQEQKVQLTFLDLTKVITITLMASCYPMSSL